jgi:hypothetical protein
VIVKQGIDAQPDTLAVEPVNTDHAGEGKHDLFHIAAPLVEAEQLRRPSPPMGRLWSTKTAQYTSWQWFQKSKSW